MDQSSRRELISDTGLTSNMEDYIETIWVLSMQKKVVRVKDIAADLDIKMPSVSAALNKLKEMGLIDYEKYGFIELTEKGKSLAQKVYGRHSCLKNFFSEVLGLDINMANDEACRAEHVLSPEVCVKMGRLLDFYSVERSRGSEWVAKLQSHLKKAKNTD